MIAITEEHEELRRTARRWLEAHCPPEVARAALEAPPGDLPGLWKELGDQGWLGLHVSEAHGGQGFGLLELAVVLEEMGRAGVPGPVLPTLVVSAAMASFGSDTQRRSFLPGLVDGTAPAGLALGAGTLTGTVTGGAGAADLTVSGRVAPVLGGPTAQLVLAPVALAGEVRWCLVEMDPSGSRLRASEAHDPTRPLGALELSDTLVPASHRLEGCTTEWVLETALVLACAESAGGARWCLETASEHAKVRVQFGRPIGQFQAIKHRLADMLVVVEQCEATAWDAATARDADAHREASLSAAAAGSVVLDGFLRCAKDCVQVLGGIGFTWEHDAHRYLKRAMATRLLLGEDWRHRVAGLALAGVRRSLEADLPAEAEAVRAGIAPVVARARELEGPALRDYLVGEGLVAPHWPRPWGRAAGPLEQLVLDEELTGVERPHLGVGAWALPTLIAHATPDQQERWVRPTLLGTLAWCQLFSEPGAGSDLANLSTRAQRVDGGWLLNGQKVWTSLAQVADWGVCLARSDPDAPKHDGISYFIVDMKSKGIDIRPLRELTGAAMFNEVFFDDVFVPDDCLVGLPGDGWRIGRTTLANERVSMSSGSAFGIGVESLLKSAARRGWAEGTPTATSQQLGELLAEAHSIRLLGQRATLRSLSGMDPGATASVRKLLGAEHEQRVQEAGLLFQGPEGTMAEGSSARWGMGFLATRCLTIAGGTSEVQRNVIAERLLGLPRDPEPGR